MWSREGSARLVVSMRCAALLALAFVVGCTPSPPATKKTSTPSTPNTPSTQPCDPTRIPLLLQFHDDLPVRAWVPVVKDGAKEHFLFDTGSSHTFLHGRPPGRFALEPGGAVEMACRHVALVAHEGLMPPGPDGRSAIGLVGTDVVLPGLTEVDLRNGAIALHSRMPAETATWSKVPIEVAGGIVVTNAEVDGKKMRLMVDTGTDTLLVLDPEIPEEGATPSHDSGGNPLRMVPRWAMLRWDTAEPRKMRAWRLRSHPAFEAHAARIGGADGILGLAVLGRRRVIFDAKNRALHLER